jgi:hypothetical protein
MIEGYESFIIEGEALQRAMGKANLQNGITMAEIKIVLKKDSSVSILAGQTLSSQDACEVLLGIDGFRQFREEMTSALSESHELQKCVRHMSEIMVRHLREEGDER